VVDFDARLTDTHPDIVDAIFSHGSVDLVIVAFGVLGDTEQAWHDQSAAVALGEINYVGALSVGVLVADRLTRQGHGQIIALSSVAGEYVRRANFVYGSSKSGFDSFYLNLGQALHDTGVKVLVVRPGQVTTRMVAGRQPAPLTVTPDQVARVTAAGVARGQKVVWVPRVFRYLLVAYRMLPGFLRQLIPF
jgi:decaprenylphospho-beta-D-erythro-pentofuranosid-2-ulose 2-reductase